MHGRAWDIRKTLSPLCLSWQSCLPVVLVCNLGHSKAMLKEHGRSQLTHRHGDLLGDIPHAVVQVDLGVKGICYRVYAGPYGDLQRAMLVKNALKGYHSHCF